MGSGAGYISEGDAADAAPKRRSSLGRFATYALLTLMGMGLLGQLVRDRSVAWALLFYLPLPLLGAVAVLLDLLRRGRSLPGARFMLAVIGFILAFAASLPLIGRGPDPAAHAALSGGGTPVRLLHWNAHGGDGAIDGLLPNRRVWGGISEQILRRRPDVVVLSEAPAEHYAGLLEDLRARLGAGWALRRTDLTRGEYFVRLAVYARGPVRFDAPVPVPDGVALPVTVRTADRTLRLLVVDGRSSLLVHRTALLEQIAAQAERQAAEGERFDVIVGDFNTPRRSRGFDAFPTMAGGYALGAAASRGWRGTFPSCLPLYDIDHVWVRNDWPLRGAQFFGGLRSDHRGQVVEFVVPSKQ